MNKRITSRDDLLLAKIAGHQVDLSTMTPPNALNAKEQYLLEIADRMEGRNSDDADTQHSGCLLVKYSGGEVDASIADIYSAWSAGTPVFMKYNKNIIPISSASENSVSFKLTTIKIKSKLITPNYNIAQMIQIDGYYNSNMEEIWEVAATQTDPTPPTEIGVTYYTINNDFTPLSITLNITARDLYRNIETGNSVRINFLMQTGTGSYTRINSIIPIEAFCKETGATIEERVAEYFFKARFDMSSADKLFVSELLTDDSPVVLTRVE